MTTPILTAKTHINELRLAIYRACGVARFSKGYRSRKLRKVCPFTQGLDLRRKSDVVALAQHLGVIKPLNNVIHLEFGVAA
ncbi:MAG: hypothetical protein AAFY20_09415 [Cyanobacteria bacterium J06639_14]